MTEPPPLVPSHSEYITISSLPGTLISGTKPSMASGISSSVSIPSLPGAISKTVPSSAYTSSVSRGIYPKIGVFTPKDTPPLPPARVGGGPGSTPITTPIIPSTPGVLATPGIGVIPIGAGLDDTTNPFTFGSTSYTEFDIYYKPVLVTFTKCIVSDRQVITDLIVEFKGAISPLAKMLIKDQIVKICIGLPFPMFIRAEVYGILSTGTFKTPSELREKYLLDKLRSYELKMIGYLKDLKSKTFMSKGSTHKSTFKTKTPEGAKTRSFLAKSSKSSLNTSSIQTSTLGDITLDPKDITPGAAATFKPQTLEESYRGSQFQAKTVFQMMNLVYNNDLSDVFSECLDDITLEGGVCSNPSTSFTSGAATSTPKAKKTYTPDSKGKMEQMKDMYSESGLSMSGVMSTTKQGLVMLPSEATKRLAASSSASQYFGVTGWDTLKPPGSKRHRLDMSYSAKSDDDKPQKSVRFKLDPKEKSSRKEHLTASISGSPMFSHDLSGVMGKLQSTSLRANPAFKLLKST